MVNLELQDLLQNAQVVVSRALFPLASITNAQCVMAIEIFDIGCWQYVESPILPSVVAPQPLGRP